MGVAERVTSEDGHGFSVPEAPQSLHQERLRAAEDRGPMGGNAAIAYREGARAERAHLAALVRAVGCVMQGVCPGGHKPEMHDRRCPIALAARIEAGK